MDIRTIVVVGVVALLTVGAGVKWADSRRADRDEQARCQAMRADPSINAAKSPVVAQADVAACERAGL